MSGGVVEWNGPACCMCYGTGALHICTETPIPGTPFTEATRDIRTNYPCPTCNGHGREAVA